MDEVVCKEKLESFDFRHRNYQLTVIFEMEG